MSSTQNSNIQQSYEEYFKPQLENQETTDAHLLLVHLPGFTRQQVGANFEAAFKRIRVFGEKPIENNKRIRFSVEHIIPENCDADKLKGQFQEGAIITITMPKKPKEPEPAQEQEAAKEVTTPPKSASEVESEETAMKNGKKDVSEEKPKSEKESSQRESDEKKDETPTPPEVTEESKMPQKDTQKDQKDHGDEKMKESTEDSSSITEKEKGSGSGIPQKDQEGEGIPQEDLKNDKNQQKTSEPGKAPLQKDQCLLVEKGKELERKESDLVIATESSGLKTPEKTEKEALFQKDQCLAKEKSKELERKESDIGLKKTPEKKKEKQMDVQSDKVNEERNHGKTVSESSSISKGIKDMANSASQAVTRLANSFSDEDKQKKLLCAGAAILVVAVGIYASFKLRSQVVKAE